MIKKKHFTLLEVLIALSLSAVIMTSLLFFYRYLSEMSQAVNRIEIENFQARMVQSRLAQAFYQIEGEPFKADSKGKNQSLKPPQQRGQDNNQEAENPPTEQEKTQEKDKFVFFTGDDEGILKPDSFTLTFLFDNGPSINTPFANTVLAKIFVDKDNRLIMALWPHPKLWSTMKPPMNLEVLMENVDKVTYKFYVPMKDPKENEQNPNPELRPGSWVDQWRREYGQIPGIVKVEVHSKEANGKPKMTTFAYPLIDKTKVIEYTK